MRKLLFTLLLPMLFIACKKNDVKRCYECNYYFVEPTFANIPNTDSFYTNGYDTSKLPNDDYAKNYIMFLNGIADSVFYTASLVCDKTKKEINEYQRYRTWDVTYASGMKTPDKGFIVGIITVCR